MKQIPLVNTHIHTPHSFSAFESTEQAANLARRENLRALGISDFNTVEGYKEFAQACSRNDIHPLYGIEFIALSQKDKIEGLRWNDPKNPGAMYFCGKALSHPVSFSEESSQTLSRLWDGTQEHIRRMIDKLNQILSDRGFEVSFTYEGIRDTYARKTVRERHLALALFKSFETTFGDSADRLDAYRKLFGDSGLSRMPDDSPSVQNEIRSRMFKAGRPAYVEEDESAFLPFETVRDIILDSGGIPCYPVLADDSTDLNEHERDVVRLADSLTEMNVHAVEFIPLRNSFDHLKSYVRHFREREFCITFGTEHNTPKLISMIPMARNDTPFDDELAETAFEGACVLAAHQSAVRQGREGFVSRDGALLRTGTQRDEFIKTGAASLELST